MPKFYAKVIVNSENKFKMHKYNALAMIGIRPPRPKKRLSDIKLPQSSAQGMESKLQHNADIGDIHISETTKVTEE